MSLDATIAALRAELDEDACNAPHRFPSECVLDLQYRLAEHRSDPSYVVLVQTELTRRLVDTSAARRERIMLALLDVAEAAHKGIPITLGGPAKVRVQAALAALEAAAREP